ncbi:MAG: DUF805 domain-containing protein [Hyphomonas sp.]|mgnify:CR=1 FL=1|jgi:uncharacterized membrane protein YhaH (DUF805 family)|nr:DUF805 domain-containing protein [Hyphomonas sp.]
MMGLLFSPNGRIDQPTYWRSVLILLAISVAISVLSAFVSPFLSVLGLIFIWPWIAVHVKRFHDAGKTGWLTIAMVALALIASTVLSFMLPGLFGVDQLALQAEMQEEIERASRGGAGEAFAATMEATKLASQATLLPSIASTALVTGIVGAVMGVFKTDPNDNQYGPGPAGASTVFN